MRVPTREDLHRVILDVVQPMYRGVFESSKGLTARLKDLPQFGPEDSFQDASPYGFVSKPRKGVFAYFLNLMGNAQAPVVFAHLDAQRPEPSTQGEVIVYCSNEDGAQTPVRITLKTGGVLEITAASKVQIKCDNVEIGNGTLEKVLNGESFRTWANNHTHFDSVGGTTQPPTVPSTPDHLSSQVKAGT